jgi:predicted ester cyclase
MDIALNQTHKRLVHELWQAQEDMPAERAAEALRRCTAQDVLWHGPDPLLELRGIEAQVRDYWVPLKAAFRDLKRHTWILHGGPSNGRRDGDMSQDGRMWVGGTGVFAGTFENDYLGIPANGKPVSIRGGEYHRFEGGRIVETFCLLDLVDLIEQAGLQVLPPCRGVPGLYPPPRAMDGVLLDPQSETLSRESLQHIWQFIFAGLNRFDQSQLASMGMARWFQPQVKWYGPGGIGACLSLKAFEDHHQQPWLVAYPDRKVQDLDALIAEGAYSGGPGWAGVVATHTGSYLDQAATGRRITFNGMDWWKREGDQYVENWVFVDFIHLFRQFGVDLLARAAVPAGRS